MAGRAGRRGIDDRGYAFTLADFNFFVPEEFPSMREDEIEPLRSRFTVSYNSVSNLVRKYSDDEIRDDFAEKFRARFKASGSGSGGSEALESAQRRLETLEQQDADAKARRRARRRVRVLERDLAKSRRRTVCVEFAAKRRLLEQLDYIRDDDLTARGEFAAMINIQELLVTELFFAAGFTNWTKIRSTPWLCPSITNRGRPKEIRPQRL